MNLDEQQDHFVKFVDEMSATLFSKGNDYSNEDRLSNFKLAGSIAGVSAPLNCLNLIATKVARLGVLLNTKNKPNNESISDTILDLANYSVLLSMLISEDENKKDNLPF